MLTSRAPGALSFRRIDRANLDAILALDYDRSQVAAFLGPIEDILGEVRRGLAHSLFGIEDATGLVGFFVVHPDRRDRSCWWLGWFTIDRRYQGRGYGRTALVHVIEMLRRLEGCRRIRLLVAHDNLSARRLYEHAGFEEAGRDDEGWHILDYRVPAHIPTGVVALLLGPAIHCVPAKRTRRRLRLRPTAGPSAARSIGPVRGPPLLERTDKSSASFEKEAKLFYSLRQAISMPCT